MWDSPGQNFTSCRHWKSQAKDSITAEVMGTSQFHNEKVDLKSISRVVQVISPYDLCQHTQYFSLWTFFHLHLTCLFSSLCRPGSLLPHLTVCDGHAPDSSFNPKATKPSSPPAQHWLQYPPFPWETIGVVCADVAGLTPDWWLFPEDAEGRKKPFSERSQPMWYFPFLEIENCSLWAPSSSVWNQLNIPPLHIDKGIIKRYIY